MTSLLLEVLAASSWLELTVFFAEAQKSYCGASTGNVAGAYVKRRLPEVPCSSVSRSFLVVHSWKELTNGFRLP